MVPGKLAPLLIKDYMVDSMKPGSVVVDLAAEWGGNCEYTQPGRHVITERGVHVVGYTDFVSRVSEMSSHLYADNVCALLEFMGKANHFSIAAANSIIRAMLITHDGVRLWPRDRDGRVRAGGRAGGRARARPWGGGARSS